MQRVIGKECFIVVAHIDTRRVTCVLQVRDSVILEHVGRLAKAYPPSDYDIIQALAYNVADLKNQYPEFSGWDYITVTQILG